MMASRSADVSALAKQITELEQRLKSLLKSPQPDEKSVRPVRLALRDNYEKLLLLDHKYATESQVEQSLWKLVFYKRIEDYRKRHSKINSGVQVAEKKERATDALKALNISFSKFLEESKSFYLALLRKLLSMCGIYINDYSQEVTSRASSMVGDELIWSCHRCLLYIGDLDRYAQLYVEGGQSDWRIPEKHYDAASMLLPHVGNPYNQIAVLATYRADDLAGVYFYARALLCASPFITARENLSLLLEKNRTSCRNLHGRHLSKATMNARSKKLTDFCLRFVRLLGILWTKLDMGEYKMIESSLLVEFIALLDAGDLDGFQLVMVVVTTIFVIHQLENDLIDEIENSIETPSTRICMEYALGLVFQLVCKICISARVRECQMATLCIFTDWLGHNMKFLVPTDVQSQGNKEVRIARQAFIENVVDFLNLNSSNALPHAESEPLPEDLDLIGFLPLATAHQNLLSKITNGALIELKQRSKELGSSKAKYLRIRKLENFAQKLASGPRPVLFYDSQTGEYNVEGSGVFHVATPAAADCVQSQQRGKAAGSRNNWSSVPGKNPKSGSKEASKSAENKTAKTPQTATSNGCMAAKNHVADAHEPVNHGHTAQEMGSVAPAPLQDEMLGDAADDCDDETFGVAVSADGPVPDDFSAWAEQTAAFAALHPALATSPLPEGRSISRQPEEAEDVSDHYLELLVQKAIGTAAGDETSAAEPAATSMETDDDEQEEIILFKPTGRANPDAGPQHRGATADCRPNPHGGRPNAPCSGAGGAASAGLALGNGCGVAPGSGLWGAPGRGGSHSGSVAAMPHGAAAPCGRFEWAGAEAGAGAAGRLDEAAAAKVPEGGAERSRQPSRFVTRNPFAS